jgi:alkylhydroperoxidase family enzyme
MSREAWQRDLRDGARKAILEGPAKTSPEARRAAFEGRGEPGPVADYVANVAQNAYRVDDEMVAAVKAAGLDDERIFELTVAAAVGQATRQFASALAALDAATQEKA